MINVEVKHHDDKPKLDEKTHKVKIYIEKYAIFDRPIKECVKHMQDELTAIFIKYKSIYSIRFYID